MPTHVDWGPVLVEDGIWWLAFAGLLILVLGMGVGAAIALRWRCRAAIASPGAEPLPPPAAGTA